MKNATKAVIAGVAGLALLTGGVGSLAYWTDSKDGSSVTIQAGDLALGSIADGTGWTITQNAPGIPKAQTTGVAYVPGTTKIVPGDVLTKTVTVPVTVTGDNNRATLAVSQVAPTSPNALDGVLIPSIVSVNGVAGSTATISSSATQQSIAVVVSITFPWGPNAGDGNTAKTLGTSFQASYSLTQTPVTP